MSNDEQHRNEIFTMTNVKGEVVIVCTRCGWASPEPLGKTPDLKTINEAADAHVAERGASRAEHKTDQSPEEQFMSALDGLMQEVKPRVEKILRDHGIAFKFPF